LVDFNADKVKAWLAKGAQPTDKVRFLLGKMQILPPLNFEGKPKRKSKKEIVAEAAEAKAAPEAAANAPAAPKAAAAETVEEKAGPEAAASPEEAEA
jgi:small subunit ribosomal protein S16